MESSMPSKAAKDDRQAKEVPLVFVEGLIGLVEGTGAWRQVVA